MPFRAIWFLADEEQEALRQGQEPSAAAENAGYHMLVSSQGLIAEANGRAVNVFARENDVSELVSATEGRSFAAVVDLVGDLAR